MTQGIKYATDEERQAARKENLKRYAAKHKEEIAAIGKAWAASHRSRMSEASRRYWETHKDDPSVKERKQGYGKEWWLLNKDTETVRRNKLSQRLRDDVLALYGNCCSTCGFSDIRALQVDHVTGNGYQERKVLHNGSTYYRKVLAAHGSNEYQLLCANCNWIKRHENKEGRRYGVES